MIDLDKSKAYSLLSLVKNYLTLDHETTSEFAAQYRKLTDQDKDDLRGEFAKMGFIVTAAERK